MGRSIARFLVLAAWVGAIGCVDTVSSKDVNEDVLWGSYSAEYNSLEGRLVISAQFRVGGPFGTTVKLESPSEVTVNGDRFSEENFLGAYYSITKPMPDPGQLPQEFTFKWKRKDGTEFTNTIAMAKPVGFASGTDALSHSRKSNLTVEIAGAPLSENEEFEVTLKATKPAAVDSKDRSFENTSISSGNKAMFSASELENFVVGTADLSVTRRKEIKAASGHEKEGGYLSSRFISRPVTISITE